MSRPLGVRFQRSRAPKRANKASRRTDPLCRGFGEYKDVEPGLLDVASKIKNLHKIYLRFLKPSTRYGIFSKPDQVLVFNYKHNIPIDTAPELVPGIVTIREIGSSPAPDRHQATTNRFVFNFIASMQSMLPIASSLARSLVTIHAITCTVIYSASSSNKLIRAL